MRVYTVQCVEAPMPPYPFDPVRVSAAGPVDALLKAGPIFCEAWQGRDRMPVARLEIIGVEPPGEMKPAWNTGQRVELVEDDE